ncbi:hypothetical protein PISMIDRAFT_46371, partial [Pisolithus microcarpus 441]
LILYLRRDLRDTDIPHRTKTRELILQHWRERFYAAQSGVEGVAVRAISFTADMWSADKLDSYLAMMAHW